MFDQNAAQLVGGSTAAQLVDLMRFDELTEQDAAFAQELIDAFVRSCADIEQELRDARATQDRRQLHRVAHKLKGAAANIHAPLLRLHAQELESCASTMEELQLDIHLAQMHLYIQQTAAYLAAARCDENQDASQSA